MPPTSQSLSLSTNPHRILGIPELLDLVFSFLDERSNTTNARVCKIWSGIALSTIWRDVHDLWRLVRLLGLLKTRLDFTYELVDPPQITDWVRFSRYASFIRHLHYNIHSPTHKHLHRSVFDEIAWNRLQLNVLPNLRTLEWITENVNDLKMSRIFMHDQVQRFIVWVPFEKEEILLFGNVTGETRYFQDVAARMPNLTYLDLRMDVPSSLVTTPVTTLLTALPALQTIILPIFHHTTAILNSVSTLPNLGVLGWGPGQGKGSIDEVQQVAPTLSEDTFPALWDLSLSATLGDMKSFLENKFTPINLTELYIECPCLQSTEEVGTFFKCVAANCQKLESLVLELHWSDFPGVYTARQDQDYITFETIKPLLACPNLVCFELSHDHPVDITQSDIETLASSWPSLLKFCLAWQPLKLDAPSITLRALLPFVRYCPDLCTLMLFIDASTTDPLTSSLLTYADAETYNTKQFRNLTSLSMGVSSIENEGAVALFLSRLCPLGCKIDCDVSWTTTIEEESEDDDVEFATRLMAKELLGEVTKRCAKWNEVGRMLPLLTRSRMEEW